MKAIGIVIGILLFAGCYKSNPSEIVKIELAKGTCLGPCIPKAISIDSALNYKFYADSSYTGNKIRPKKAIVNYRGKIDRKLWDALVKSLENANYKHADTIKKIEVMDVQYIELIVYWGKNKTTITEENDSIKKIIDLMDGSYAHAKLYPTNEMLIFGTKLQTPFKLNRKR